MMVYSKILLLKYKVVRLRRRWAWRDAQLRSAYLVGGFNDSRRIDKCNLFLCFAFS